MKTLLILAFASVVFARQRVDPVHWALSSDVQVAPAGTTVPVRLTATLEPGWHLYSLTTSQEGAAHPIQTKVSILPGDPIESWTVYQPKPDLKFDPNFQLKTETFEKEVVFWFPISLKKGLPAGPVEIGAQARYQACNDKECRPPKTAKSAVTVNITPSATVPAAFVVPSGYTEVKPGALRITAFSSRPVDIHPADLHPADQSIWAFLLTAFGFGLAAVFTPCVFPMIPITVSFFLNQRGGLLQAVVFSLGIVGLFCALGFGVTAALGPFGVVTLGSSPWVNGFIALVFGIFALSLLGAFEITLPSGLLTKMDRVSRRGGYLGTLLMGLTFSLTSFACVGPFVGPLLASSVQGQGGAQPVLGMASFAAGLASPFFFLAAFPAYLKKLPRSGGWLVRVKVVMGFVLIAVMFKYLSNIDQVLQSDILTRERFLAVWVVMFAMAGLYLLGQLRLEGIEAEEKVGVGRLVTGCAFLIFAFSLLPGMFGSPLGKLDAYVPASKSSIATGPQWMKDQYQEALARGRQDNKLVLVKFTGYSCTNCHAMEANMFPKPEIAAALQDLVLVDLYLDGPDGEKNQQLEEGKFKILATMPFFALMDADEKVVKTIAYTGDPKEFLEFLKSRPS